MTDEVGPLDFAGDLDDHPTVEKQPLHQVGIASFIEGREAFDRHAMIVAGPPCFVPIPMRLLHIPEPFDHPDWIFEPKMDGFERRPTFKGTTASSSPATGHVFKSWPQLAEKIAHSVRAHSAILYGEICCLKPGNGRARKQRR